MRSARLILKALLVTLSAGGCTPRPAEPIAALPPAASALAHRGESVYRTMCLSCHNADPRKVGAVGPAVAGSSDALIEARLLRSSYPSGYQPQRDTHQMPQYPQLATEVSTLGAYLRAFAESPERTAK